MAELLAVCAVEAHSSRVVEVGSSVRRLLVVHGCNYEVVPDGRRFGMSAISHRRYLECDHKNPPLMANVLPKGRHYGML